MIDVLTCILSGYDNLRIPEPESGVRYLCYTDEPHYDARPWRIQPAHMNGDMARSSRLPKILSHLHTDAEVSIWIDGCFCPKAAGRFVADKLGDADVVAFEHPRQNAFAEVEYCSREGVGDGTAIDAQLARYRAEGYTGEPFVCGGIIGRRENAAVREFNELWWREYRAGQSRDQFSLSYALWRSGVKLNIIRGVDILQNPWFGFNFHAWQERAGQNPEFASQRERMAKRAAEIRRLTA